MGVHSGVIDFITEHPGYGNKEYVLEFKYARFQFEGEGGRGQEESVWEAYEVDTIRQKH